MDQKTGEIGFVQYFDKNPVERITCLGNYGKVGTYKFRNNANITMEMDKEKFYGIITVHFHNKPPKELNNIEFSPTHIWATGMPVARDGSKLFVGSWEKVIDGVKMGLRAYDIETGALLWRLDEGKIGDIFVYSTYLIVEKQYASIFKLDIDSGAVLGLIKSGTIEKMFDLGTPYVLADTISGKLCVINTNTMEIVKNYGGLYKSKLINPSNCLSLSIVEAGLQNNTLIISGFESYPDRNYDISDFNSKAFDRIIDTAFME